MSRNDPEDYAQRLYARVPAHYRVYDAEQGQPLLTLLRLVGRQVANLRQDLDDLWDNFFIETCDDWVVPYLGALVGTNLLPQPVGQSNRLDVWRTILWRRSKGTPAMLRALAQAISGWPTDLAEFFQMLGWSQNMNHLRLDHPLTPDLHDPYPLSRLGHADNPFAHAADFRPARPLDPARVTPDSRDIGRAAWSTPGRYQIKNLGFFTRRLQPFVVQGATPAAVQPGLAVPGDAAGFTFDPLFRETPLFVEQTGAPLSRAAFDRAPWETFGTDVAVRQFGVLLAGAAVPQPSQTSGGGPGQVNAFNFGGAGAGLALHPTAGLRLLEPRRFGSGGVHFVIKAAWQDGGAPAALGSLSTLLAALGASDAYRKEATATGSGKLVITVQTGRASLGWPGLPASPPGRFPGAILAVRADRSGPLHVSDALYVYLPPATITPDGTSWYVADDGSTYTTADLSPSKLARASQGQVYPPGIPTSSTAPADEFTQLNRKDDELRLPDPARFGGAGVLIEASLFTGAFQPLGAIVTVDQPADAQYPGPNPWPALQYRPSKTALDGDVPPEGLLSIQVKPLSGGNFVPASELIIRNRRGQSLLVYLEQVANAPAEGKPYFVADDGSTYDSPTDDVGRRGVLAQKSFAGLPLARAGSGQVLPIPGVWPLQQRRPVAINLCRSERNALLLPGELGIDPELGRFALAPGDPVIGQKGLSVDYVEAFSDRVGARTFDRQLDPKQPASRLVAQTGDADSSLTKVFANAPLHTSVADALAQAADGDVIEIVDSATYAAATEIAFNAAAVKKLTLRAASGQRPCLSFFTASGAPTGSSFHLGSPLDKLELNGLLMSGGPLRIDSAVKQLCLIACTLDPSTASTVGSLVASDADLSHQAAYLLCRCITGGLAVAAGISRLTIADAIVDQQGGFAIGGLAPGSAAGTVQLERVTVLGKVRCDVLQASECCLDAVTHVEDRQAGCLRFSRFELGSVLPRRFQCVPNDAQAAACKSGRCLAPRFNSRRFGRPDYAQLAAACPPEILSASQEGAEIGAFTGARNPIRLANLNTKRQEFLPVGLSALVIAET